MSPRWYEIPEDKAALMFERHERGDSFSKIGSDLSIDRRTVARVVREFQERRAGIAVIRRDELARIFQKHLDDMREAAKVLLRVSASPGVRGNLLPTEEDFWEGAMFRLTHELRESETELPGMPPEQIADLELKQLVGWRLAARRARSAIEGLKEHVPVLESKLSRWQEANANYCQSWNDVRDEALANGIPQDSIEHVVRMALVHPPGEEHESLKLITTGNAVAADEQLAISLLNQQTTKRLLRILWHSLNQLNAHYEDLEELLSLPQLDRALVTGRCRYCPVP